jgi:hypothetical protein
MPPICLCQWWCIYQFCTIKQRFGVVVPLWFFYAGPLQNKAVWCIFAVRRSNITPVL